jgi:small subunit ribosomal protein S16
LATVIRLARYGKRHNPVYRLVVADNRKPRDGKFLEQVGFYDPNQSPVETKFETESIMQWLGKGAQPSDTVKSLFKNAGIWEIWISKKTGAQVSTEDLKARADKPKRKKLGPKAKARAVIAATPAPEPVAEVVAAPAEAAAE